LAGLGNYDVELAIRPICEGRRRAMEERLPQDHIYEAGLDNIKLHDVVQAVDRNWNIVRETEGDELWIGKGGNPNGLRAIDGKGTASRCRLGDETNWKTSVDYASNITGGINRR